MKSLDLWLRAINRYETRNNAMSPFEGTYAGFMQCLQQPEAEPNRELLKRFSTEAFYGASKEWTREMQVSWLLALVEIEGFDLFSVKEEGCLFARMMMVDGPPELREKAVAAWTSFTKLMMKQ